LPKTDYRAADQQAPAFSGLVDASAEPPSRDQPPPRNDNNARRADAASNDPPPARSTDNSRSDTQDDATADTSNPAPQKSANAANGKSEPDAKTDADAPKPDQTSATDGKSDEAAAAAAKAASDALAAAAVAAPAPTPIAVAAPVAVAVALIAQSTPETDPPGTATAPVAAAATLPAPAVTNPATATKAETGFAAANITGENVSPDTATEKLNAAIAGSQQPAAKSRTKSAAADEKTPHKTASADDTQAAAADEADAGTNPPAVDHAAELLKSLHATADAKAHNPAQAEEAGTDHKSADDVAIAVAADNNVPSPQPNGVGVAAAGATAQTANASAPSTAAADNAVPLAGLAVEIATNAHAGKNRFEIRLDPPDLGRIDVRLDIDRHGNVTSRLLVERADTFDLLRRDFSGLERALNDAGLKTGDNSLQFAMRDQGFGSGQQPAGEFTNVARVVVPTAAEPSIGAPRYTLPRLGGVDISV
jgi:chemotaxis protein MotD